MPIMENIGAGDSDSTIELEITEIPVPVQKSLHQPYCLIHHDAAGPECHTMTAHAASQKPTSYTMNQIKTIYRFPNPSAAEITVAIISFGGSLVGTLTNGVLTNGDPQAHWLSLGIQPANQPRVLIVPVNGARIPAVANTKDIATIENTLDVETVGALCPTSKLTIILYIANPWDDFPGLMNAAMNPTTVNGHTYTPSIISCSWGTSESNYYIPTINSINAIFRTAVDRGITITAATGDYGSSNGTSFTVTDFPSSSPYVLACGGTTLLCPNSVYDSHTVETAWTNGGGGISQIFAKPAYQSALPGSYRCTPDIVMVADPDTGIVITLGNAPMVIGGTSFVSPAMAAFTAAINLKQALTPLLYSYPSITFHDITVGSNGAYVAGPGYDHCTGRGSINGTELVARIQSSVSPSPPSPPPLSPTQSIIPVTGITLSGSTSIRVGETISLTATVAPATATNQTVRFSTTNAVVASVTATGSVRGLSGGTVTITATAIDGGYTASTTITVTTIPVTGVILTGPTKVIVGESVDLIPIITPTTASNKSVTFESSDIGVATVSAAGLVSGLAEGTATITVTTVDSSYSASIEITIITIPVTSMTLRGESALIIGQTTQLRMIFQPPMASNKTVIYSVNKPAIASVSASGLVTAIAAGFIIVTATSSNGISAGLSISIINVPVEHVMLTGGGTIIIGRTLQLKTTIFPSLALNKAVSYASSNTSVATVSVDGIVTGISAGSATITVTTADGSKQNTTVITVTPVKVTGVSLSTANLQVRLRGTSTLIPIVRPSTAVNKAVNWTSTNPKIASVSNGVIVGVSQGNCQIIVTTVDGNLAATCNIAVM